MHISGLLGMPRRVFTYADGMGWDWLNLITTVGSFVFAIGVLLFIVNVVVSYRRGPRPATIPGMRRRSNGQRVRRHLPITSR